MADNFNTYQTIGNTVSFDALFRGIENMGKAIAAARTAKAKASLKKDELLSKMISDKQIEKGMTPLQAQINNANYQNFLVTAQNKMASDPNTALNSINSDWANYQTQADIFKDQSNIELDIRKKSSEGYAVKSDVIQDFNEASKEGNMSRFFSSNERILDLARQGVYVTPTPFKTKNIKGEEIEVPWALITTDLQKQKDLSQELKRYTSDPANYDETVTISDAETIKKSNKGNQVAEEKKLYTFKASKKSQLADELSNDKEIQRYYLFNDNVWNDRTKDLFDNISLADQTKDFPLQTRLAMAAKQAIYYDVMNNTDLNQSKENIMQLSQGSTTNVKVINPPKPVNVVNTKSGDIPLVIDGKTVNAQSAGLQEQWARQDNYTAKGLTFRAGQLESKSRVFLDSNMKPLSTKLSEIASEWEYTNLYMINGEVYVEAMPTLTADKKVNVNTVLIKVEEGSDLDSRFTKLYTVNGVAPKSMKKWSGWKKENLN